MVVNGDFIYVYPDEIWDFVKKEWKNLEVVPQIIAENNIGNVQICIEVLNERPQVTVESYDIEVLCERISESNAEKVLQEIYDDWLVGNDALAEITYEPDGESYDEPDVLDQIEYREWELTNAVEDLLGIVFGDLITDDEAIEKAKDWIIRGLSEQFPKEQIYRPLIITDEKGEEFFSEYPYEEWDLQ